MSFLTFPAEPVATLRKVKRDFLLSNTPHSKASFMFLVKNKPVGKEVLGNTFSKCMKQKEKEGCETDSKKKTIEKLEREIR